MSIYCDTSLLFAALVREPATSRVQTWFGRRQAGSLFISDWSLAEFPSAVSINVRAGTLSLEDRAGVLASWSKLRETSLEILPVLSVHFATAATYVEHVDLRLRAADALHLAIASDHGCAIATLDSAQGKAAIELGIPLERV